MALAPLRPGPHTVRADRLAFAAPVPVREAGGAGHWVTVGHHGEDDEGGGVHIFISSGGTVEKGPRALLGHHIGAVASHPGAGKVKHHPAGHEPPGARDHPHYAEREAQPPAPTGEGEPTKRPGKPYARLSGAEQGTRHEQIGKALSEAQSAAKGAKAAQGQNRVADTAVAHQQAQADLAAHRARADRNPNPWAPHLSPPVGDAKDKELAEKATRAQLAHQAAQAQQQGAQQQQQQEGQRAHEKEMVRLKAETAQPKPLGGKPAAAAAPGKQEPPTAKTERTLFAQPNYLRDHLATRSEMDLRRDAEGLAGMHRQAIKRQIGMERAGDTSSEAYKTNAQHAAMLNKHAAAVNDRLEDIRQKRVAGSESELRGPERRGGGPHDTLVHDQPATKPAFSAPQPKAQEKPQTAPQPEQTAAAPQPSPEHRDALREGRKLLGQKALDPATHKAKVEAAVHRASSSDPFEGAQRGYARHGDEYALRLAHLEAAGHYQNQANVLQRQHLALTNQDKGGVLAKAQRHIETLTHHEQRAQGHTHPESEQQARDLLARSQAIGRHYTSGVQRLNAKVQEHRDAHKRLTGAYSWVARESAAPAARFSAPAVR